MRLKIIKNIINIFNFSAISILFNNKNIIALRISYVFFYWQVLNQIISATKYTRNWSTTFKSNLWLLNKVSVALNKNNIVTEYGEINFHYILFNFLA